MKYLKIVTLFIICISGKVLAENPDDLPIDTIALQEIEISANRLINFTTGAKIQNIIPIIKNDYNTTNLSELFSQVTTASVTSYGIAGVSNVSLRGMGTKHTAILWNGINLQNSMNGGFDMSSIPSVIIDEIDVQYGGSGALFGSGAVGGIIHLNNSLNLDNSLSLTFQEKIGSFNNNFESLKLDISNTNIASSSRVYYKYGKNDFNYTNTQQFGSPNVKQENSATNQYGIFQSNLFKINDKQKISTNIWFQHHYLEVPAMTTASISSANQNTDLARIAAIWNRCGEISSWYSRLYYNYESLVYKDSLIDLVSEMDNYSVIAEFENKTSIGNHFLLNTGINNTYQEVITNNYNSAKSRNQSALFSSLKYFNDKNTFAAILSIRKELIDNKLNPFTFSVSSRYYLFKFLNINTSISKTYNTPTFNDLYWVPGGNSELESESGWSEDLGLDFSFKYGKNNLNFNATIFNINLNNQIIWLPTSSSYWSAENVEKLWSRGLESNVLYQLQLTNWKFLFSGNYSYTKSTYDESANTELSSIGKQLLYIPKHKGNSRISVAYKNTFLTFALNYVSRRYITKDNSRSIDPYLIGDLSLGTNVIVLKSSFQAQFKVNNIWNETYEVMAFYAMPLRYYSISLSYNFKKSNH